MDGVAGIKGSYVHEIVLLLRVEVIFRFENIVVEVVDKGWEGYGKRC